MRAIVGNVRKKRKGNDRIKRNYDESMCKTEMITNGGGRDWERDTCQAF